MRKCLVLMLLFCSAAMFGQSKTDVRKVGNVGNVQALRAQVTPEVALQRQVDLLKIQVKELKKQLDMVAQQTSAIKNSFPKCSADLQTSSSNLGTRDCAPYACDSVVGTCLMQCATTFDCARGYTCDIEAARCVYTH